MEAPGVEEFDRHLTGALVILIQGGIKMYESDGDESDEISTVEKLIICQR